jgi:hypothetical protein
MASTLIECQQQLEYVRNELSVCRPQKDQTLKDRYGVPLPSPTILVAELEDNEHELECHVAYLEGRACYISHAPL